MEAWITFKWLGTSWTVCADALGPVLLRNKPQLFRQNFWTLPLRCFLVVNRQSRYGLCDKQLYPWGTNTSLGSIDNRWQRLKSLSKSKLQYWLSDRVPSSANECGLSGISFTFYAFKTTSAVEETWNWIHGITSTLVTYSGKGLSKQKKPY